MLLVYRINIYIILLFFVGLNQSALAGHAADSAKYKIESKYKKEYTPYFKFETFYRGEKPSVIKKRLDSLSAKPKGLWKRKDSLLFAKTNLLAGNTHLAEHYFSNINIDPNKNLEDNLHDLASIYLAKDFHKGISKIKKNYPRIIQYSKIYFLKQIFEGQDSIAHNPNWYKTNPSIFKFKIDSNLVRVDKKDEHFKHDIIEPLNNATEVLHIMVYYIHDNDQIIARAFNDIGVVLEKYLSLYQAYIAYSIGRNYNKKDKEILQNIKNIKAKILLKNYKIPNFRKYFPRTEEGRFDYEILKEKIIQEQNDTIVFHDPILVKKQIKKEYPFPIDIIVPAGLLVLFLLILLLVRTQKK